MTHHLAGKKQSPEHVAKRVQSMRERGHYERMANDHRKEGSAERKRAATKMWKACNQERVRMHKRAFQERQRAHRAAYQTARHAAKLRAIPSWADRDEIKGMYELCSVFRRVGLKLEVDHIVPLKGENVCGLHVVENLQLMHEIDNIRKKNRFTEHAL